MVSDPPMMCECVINFYTSCLNETLMYQEGCSLKNVQCAPGILVSVPAVLNTETKGNYLARAVPGFTIRHVLNAFSTLRKNRVTG